MLKSILSPDAQVSIFRVSKANIIAMTAPNWGQPEEREFHHGEDERYRERNKFAVYSHKICEANFIENILLKNMDLRGCVLNNGSAF